MVDQPDISISVDEAVTRLLSELRTIIEENQRRDYGYDLWAPGESRRWAYEQAGGDNTQTARINQEVEPTFREAAWELCRHGILRPGVCGVNEQAVEGGGGYCLTSFARGWLPEADESQFIAMQPGSLAEVFASFRDRFGEAFYQRSQEAIRCRRAEAWIACCAMVGAAAEAILLKMAIGKTNDEDAVLETYQRRNGRQDVINLLVGQAPNRISGPFKTFMGLLSYWRDAAAHGEAVDITIANADEALRQLLHLAQWANRNWGVLVSE